MFPCEKCGACCRNIKKSELYASLDRGDGVCRYLKDNLCSIYETRPLLCRIDEGYERFFKEKYTREEYYRLNLEICHQLQAEEKKNNMLQSQNPQTSNQ